MNIQEKNKAKQIIKNNVKWSSEKPQSLGGQQCGMPNYPVILISEDLNIKITVHYHRSQLKNKQIAWTLFESALNDLIK